ncbi:MAG: lipid-binding SYLF domain-containing protein [Novipirellula sp. JB048]
MNRHRLIAALTLTLTTVVLLPTLPAQTPEEQVVLGSTAVFNEAMTAPLNRIPQAMLANAHGVAIVPNVIKGSFIVGARHGRGLLFVREPEGIWRAPVFITLTGGNIGWQIGVQSSDLILVFKTERSVQGILAGKLTLGADAAAAAGPVGRETAVATDGQLQAEIYTYSRSRGLFAGVSIDGSVVQVDPLSTAAYYRSPAPGAAVFVPPAAEQLTLAIARFAGNPVSSAAPVALQSHQSPLQPAGEAMRPSGPDSTENLGGDRSRARGVGEAEALRAQLIERAPQLYALLDRPWRDYLALPSSMREPGRATSLHELQSTIDHFEAARDDPRFQSLATRPEFQAVLSLLKHYQQTLLNPAPRLQLPPPPPPAASQR